MNNEGGTEHIRNQVSLELVQVHVQATVEAERCSDTRYDLRNQTVQVGEPRRRNAKPVLANVVDRFIVNLSSRMSGQ
jgi:hypothetical protein